MGSSPGQALLLRRSLTQSHASLLPVLQAVSGRFCAASVFDQGW